MKKTITFLALAFILIAITGCGTITEEQKADYEALEEKLEKVAVEYFDNNPHLVPTENGDTMEVQILYLYKGKYMTEKLVDPITKKECNEQTSTISITKDEDEYDYDSYLECGEYKTKLD